MSKKVILIRGPQGAGKTTLVRRAGLDGHNLSLDKIRNVVAGDVLSPNGNMTPSHEHGPLVWKIFSDSIDRRISAGEVVAIDGTMANGAELYDIWKRFDLAGYKGLLIDLYGFDDDLRRARNLGRDERERVPERSVDSMKSMAARAPIPPIMSENENLRMMRATNPDEWNQALAAIPGFLADPRCRRDLSAYEEVVHIGDLQGTFSPILDERSPLKNGIDPKKFYIFLGDLFDRGKENDKVADWFIRNALNRPNVALIAGNHEDYVELQARAGGADIDLPNSEWRRLSWPQIREAGIGWRDMRKIANFAQDYLAYEWRGREVLCSHAGFGRWPDNLDLISAHQMRRGNGHYQADVDADWSKAEAGTGRYQIHGHRNEKMRPTLASDLSFNLEGQVEFGGHMRFVQLDESGFRATEIRPILYRSMVEDMELNKEVGRMSASRFPPQLPWSTPDSKAGRLSDETIDRLRNHKMVLIKEMGNPDGLLSVNFTRQAFYDKAWDEYTTIARGLFIDGADNSIVARSYPKFFNHNERTETSAEALAANLKFPVTAYEKLNGFLCITGYSPRHDELIVASKSRTDGDFADMARTVLSDTLGEAALERIMRLNRDQACSLVFEIEEPVRDPHIIKLEAPRAVLLGCIRRSEHFEQASYKELEKIAAYVGCEVKKVMAVLPNERALASFNHRVEHDPKWRFEGRHVEGAVLEDQDGFNYKLKGHFYRNWKYMRSAVNVIAKAREAGKEPVLERFAGLPDQFQDFLAWARGLSVTALRSDIISLRESFEGDRSVMERLRDEAPAAPPPSQAVERFMALVGQIADNDRISEEGLRRFIETAMSDPDKAELLRAHDRYEDLMARLADAEPVEGPSL